jgi:hypothetical protein
VERLFATIVYAKQVKTRVARVETIAESKGEHRWKSEAGQGTIERAELRADILYAEDVQTGTLEAREVHAEKVEIVP